MIRKKFHSFFFRIENTGGTFMLHHGRSNSRLFHNTAIRGQVALKHGNTAGLRIRILNRSDNFGISINRILNILSHGLACNGHDIQVKHFTDLFHDRRYAACIVEKLRRPLSGRSEVQQIMSASV